MWSGHLMFSPFVNIFWIESYFSMHITHSSLNFTWFAFLNQQKFDDRPLFKSWDVCLISSNFVLSQKKYLCKIKIIFSINQFQRMQNLHRWKKFWPKIILLFFKKESPWFIEWPSYRLKRNQHHKCNRKKLMHQSFLEITAQLKMTTMSFDDWK